MKVFIDTSAILAVLNVNDQNHAAAVNVWIALLAQPQQLYINNYVLVEIFTLLQNRFGLEAVHLFYNNVLPALGITWVGESIHQQAVSAVLTANRRTLSLVDCTSFETMRQLGISQVFTFDEHFKEQGFEVIQ